MSRGSASLSSQRPITGGSRPILLFDIMDTVVKDPFFERMPAFFDLTFEEVGGDLLLVSFVLKTNTTNIVSTNAPAVVATKTPDRLDSI